jgi:hypothetical protein
MLTAPTSTAVLLAEVTAASADESTLTDHPWIFPAAL